MSVTLLDLYKAGIGYSCLNTAQSALSSVIKSQGKMTIGSHPLINQFIKDVFKRRPRLSRYTHNWDVNIVIKYLQSLPLKELMLKLVTFVTLLSRQRCQLFIIWT